MDILTFIQFHSISTLVVSRFHFCFFRLSWNNAQTKGPIKFKEMISPKPTTCGGGWSDLGRGNQSGGENWKFLVGRGFPPPIPPTRETLKCVFWTNLCKWYVGLLDKWEVYVTFCNLQVCCCGSYLIMVCRRYYLIQDKTYAY